MDVDQKPTPQTCDTDRRLEVIERGGAENSEAEGRKAARRFLGKCTDRAIKLDRLQKAKAVPGERGQPFEPIGGSQRRAQIVSEARRERQPLHHGQGSLNSGRRRLRPPGI